MNFSSRELDVDYPEKSLLTWLSLATEVERRFKFLNSDEAISWDLYISIGSSWTAQVSLINRSDLETRPAKKHNVIIAMACCPRIVALQPNLCGFAGEAHLSPKKLAIQIVKKLNKTRG